MFRIGEFSHLAQVSVRMLRHYDEIGLLPPAYVDPATGYRSYTSGQLADVYRIIALKDLGLTLEQVQRLVHDNVTTGDLLAMLRLEHARAARARADADRRLAELDRRLAEVRDLGDLAGIHPVEKAVPATPLWSYRTTVADLTEAETLADAALAAGDGLTGRPPLVVIGHDRFYDTEHLDLEFGFPIDGPLALDLGGGRELTRGRLPAQARMLTVVQVAGAADGHRRAHHAIALWLETHRCHLAGPVREVIHRPDNPGEPVTIEIQYPIGDRPDPAVLDVDPPTV